MPLRLNGSNHTIFNMVHGKPLLAHTQNTHSGLSGPDFDLNLKLSSTQSSFLLINLSLSSDLECSAVKNTVLKSLKI
jgi:hypothetical protein